MKRYALPIVILETICLLTFLIVYPDKSATAQDNPPAVLFESLMNSYFGDDDGLVSFGSYDLVFAPEGQASAMAGILDGQGQVVAQFPAFADYKNREGVFARLQIQGPADVQLTEPGVYTMLFVMNGKPVTRFPFALKQTGAGEDPYNPTKTYAFDGFWRRLAYITKGSYKDQDIPVVSLWLGGLDMASPDTFQAYFIATLRRDGEVVAHSKNDTSFYSNGHFERRQVQLYQPHEEKQAPNAIPLTMAELATDGNYELEVNRAEDNALLRTFKFVVEGGEIQPLPRTQLGYESAMDFIAPRVFRQGSTGYEFEEAIWIASE